MGAPKRGKWTLVGQQDVRNGKYECWEHWVRSRARTQIEHHIHLPNGETIVFNHWELLGSVKILLEQEPHPCAVCGRPIEMPEADLLEELYKYGPKASAAVLKHAWEYHREDFPPQFTSRSQLARWLATLGGKAWEKSYELFNTDEIIAEAECIIRKGKDYPQQKPSG